MSFDAGAAASISTSDVFSILGYAKIITSDSLYNLNFSMNMVSSIHLTSSHICQVRAGGVGARAGRRRPLASHRVARPRSHRPASLPPLNSLRPCNS